MGDGTKENPYTREDVLKLIEENGGTAKGLDLSEKVFAEGIDLYLLDLKGIILQSAHLEKANLQHSDLKGAYLSNALLEKANFEKTHLEKANLEIAHLEEAYLGGTHLEGANLVLAHLERAYSLGTHLEGAYLWGAKFSPETRLEQADWGNYILGEEENRWFDRAADTYRLLKIWHTDAGMYDTAGKFFYREMEARRKALGWKKKPHLKLWGWVMRLLCGYGEKPWRVVLGASVVVLGLAAIYFAIGTLTPNTFLNSLYYSAVSFTALGYGSWAPEPTGWVKGLGAFEAFLGVFMMALFLVTFTRKMTR